MVKQLGESDQNSGIDRCLGVVVSCGKNVAEGAKAGHRDNHLIVSQQLAESRHDVALQENEDALITSLVSDVRECPADVVQNFSRVVFNQYLCKGWDRSFYLIEVGARLSFAKV